MNETAEAVKMQANHFSDSLQATCNQPKGVNCYTIQYKFIQDVASSESFGLGLINLIS